MNRNFITTNVDKIIKDSSLEFPQNLALGSAWILAHYKGFNLKILDVRKLSSLADFFVMSSAENMIQANAMADEVLFHMRRNKAKYCSKEGSLKSDWILIDTGDIIVHIFQDFARTNYDLDTIWKEAPQIEIPESYYFSPSVLSSPKASDSDQNYF